MKQQIINLIWKIYNHLYVLIASEDETGVLPDRVDLKDHLWVNSKNGRQHDYIDLASHHTVKDWRFDQYPFNICVFASSMMGASWQEGIRFSVRWMVKLARREGHITGNGFSFLRSPKKLAKKYGMLPYEEMPDEIGAMSWQEYSKWTPEDEKYLEIAEKYKIKEYLKITDTNQAIFALEDGYALSTASKWYAGMNSPQKPDYVLLRSGRYMGGHAYSETGYALNLFKMTNSFGKDWGYEGQAMDTGLFEIHDYSVWVQSKLEMWQKLNYLNTYHNGKCIKGRAGTIYLLVKGNKKPFKTWDEYLVWCGKQGINSNSYSLVREDVLKALPTSKK